jgi:type III restriction enzyme
MFTAFSGEKGELTVEEVRNVREQSVIFAITKDLIKYKFSEGGERFDKFNQLKQIVTEWYLDKVYCKGDTFKQMLIYDEPHKVIGHIYRGIIASQNSSNLILPVLNFYNKFGSTKYVHGNTIKPVFETTKSHVNYVVADTESWEQIAAKTLEELDEVEAYIKNSFLGFSIPYSANRQEDNLYFPDFIARCKKPDSTKLNLIIEITGMNKDKAAKKDYVINRWVPAVNNVREQYEMDEWDFIEISNDITDIKNQLRNKINAAVKGIKETIEERLKRLEKAFGTINSSVILTSEELRRENMYKDDGR